MANIVQFQAIQQRDPDNWDQEPTEADYEAFKVWVLRNYGEQTYSEYMRGGWERSLGV